MIPLVVAMMASGWLPADHMLVVETPGVVREVADLGPIFEASPDAVVWIWNDGCSPVRCSVGRLDSCELPPKGGSLELRLDGLPEGEEQQIRVVAAPLEMWLEVPEDRLPSVRMKPSRTAKIPQAAGTPYRVRAIGETYGSGWQDIPEGRSAYRLALWPAENLDIEVRVDDGSSAARSSIAVVTGVGMAKDLEVITRSACGDDGRWDLPSVPSGAGVTVLIESEDFVPRVRWGTPAELSAAPVILEAGAKVIGVVRNAEGENLPSVNVAVEYWLDADLAIPRATKGHVQEDGTFRATGLQRGPAVVRVVADGYAEARFDVKLEGPLEDLGTVTLTSAVQLPVVIVDDTGRPVKEGIVRPSCGWPVPVGADGHVLLSGIPSKGACTIAVEAPGHVATHTDVAPPLPEILEIEIVRAFRVIGRLVTHNGQLVADGSVEIRRGEQRLFDKLANDGSFEFDLVPGVDHVLRLTSSGTAGMEIAVPAGSPGAVLDLGDLVAPSGVVATGEVVDGSGRPVEGATIWTPRPGEGGVRLAFMRDDMIRTRTDHQGRFTIMGLPSSPVVLRIDSPRTARSHVRVAPDPGERQVELGTLEVGEGAVVVVWTEEESSDQRRAEIDLRGAGLELDFLEAPIIDGRAAIPRVPPGEYSVRVVGPGGLDVCSQRVVISEHGGTEEVECVVDRLFVTGEVIESGEWAAGGALLWMRDSGSSAPAVIMQNRTQGGAARYDVLGGGGQVTVAVSLDGRFETGNLRPGSWEVTYVSPRSTPSGARLVVIRDDTEQHVILEYGGHQLLGRVVNDDDKPKSGCQVKELATSAMTFSRPDGSFEFNDLKPDVVRLVARCEALASDVATVNFSIGSPPDEVVLKVRSAERELVACVTRHNGGRVSTGLMFFETDTGGLRMKPLEADGCTRLPVIPPYPAKARVAADCEGVWAFGGWVDVSRTSDLDLVADAVGGLEITCEDECGMLSVDSSSNWNVSSLLTFLGAPLVPDPQGFIRLPGLPAGSYQIARVGAEADARTVWVRTGELTRVDLR